MVKVARGKGEDAKVTIRNIRRKAKEELDRIVRDGEAGEDEVGRAEKELQAHHRPLRRTRSTTWSSTRKPSCSRSDDSARRIPRRGRAGDRIARRPAPDRHGPRPAGRARPRTSVAAADSASASGSARCVHPRAAADRCGRLVRRRRRGGRRRSATWELRGALRRGADIEVPLPVLLVGGQAMIWLAWPFGPRGHRGRVRGHRARLPGVADARRRRRTTSATSRRACSPPRTCRCSARSPRCMVVAPDGAGRVLDVHDLRRRVRRRRLRGRRARGQAPDGARRSAPRSPGRASRARWSPAWSPARSRVGLPARRAVVGGRAHRRAARRLRDARATSSSR